MLCVLVMAAGATWEPRALAVLEATRDVVVLKRCVDVDDLLATASTGQVDAALVALEAPGLDAAAVEHLARHRVRVIAVRDGSGEGAADAARMRASRSGLRVVLAEAALDRLPTLLCEPAGEPVGEPVPASTSDDAPPPPTREAGTGARSGPGRVIVVWGPRGAPGVTTVAITMAAVLAARERTTWLVDADPHGGCVAQQLGVTDEASGLLVAARLAAAGMLADRIETAARSLGSHLRLVTGLPRPDRWVEVRDGVVEHLLELAAGDGDVVVDAGSGLERDVAADGRLGRAALTIGALGAADEIVVVGSAEPVGLARLARALVTVTDIAGETPIQVGVNRFRASLGWSAGEITGMVEGYARVRGVHFLPEDRPAVDRAVVTGQTVAGQPDSSLAVAVTGLVDAVAPALPTAGGTARRRRVTRRRAGRARRR